MIGSARRGILGAGGGSGLISGAGDVSVVAPSAGQVLTYNAGTGKWENKGIAGVAGTFPTNFVYPYPATTPPALVNWTQVNIGASTVADAYGGIALDTPADAQLHLLSKAIPATPYTITAGLQFILEPDSFPAVFLGVRDSVSGKLQICQWTCNGTSPMQNNVANYNSPTSFGANAAVPVGRTTTIGYIRVKDDGVNRIWSVSLSGYSFLQILSMVRTSFLTPDSICWGAVGCATSAARLLLFSYLEA